MTTPACSADSRLGVPSRGGWEARASCLGCLGLLAVFLAGAARGQNVQEPSAPAAGKTPAGPQAPEDVECVTSDGLVARAIYYPNRNPNANADRKIAVPVILLHSWKSDGRSEFEGLAKYLQAEGRAVLVPDLRGHGESRTFQGTTIRLETAKLRNTDVANMVTKDMEAWRKFLIQENDSDKALNLNKLCVVGSEMGAAVALQWALYDWNSVAWSGGKRRPSVKALVLLSPQTNFRGLDIYAPLANPAVREQVSVMILVGKQDARAFAQANQLYTRLEKFHPQPPSGLDKEKLAKWEAESRDLFFRTLDTRLQGSKLLEVSSFQVPQSISRFIEWRLEGNKSKDFPWQEIGKKQ
jgi:pimeloyl-ACP methyl ester carboxylesterase